MLPFAMILAALGLLLGFPDTEAGRWLRRWLVDAPAQALDRLRPGRIAFYALLGLIGLGLTLLFEAEGLRLFGMMLPETLVWFAVFDVGVFVEALLFASAIAASNGVRIVRAQIGGLRQRVVTAFVRQTGREPRPVRPKRPTPSSTDDDRPGWPAQPAYRAFSMA